MQKQFVLLLLLLPLFNNTSGQNNLPPFFEIKSDTADEQILELANYQKLEDQDGLWTFKQVIHEPLINQFHSKTIKFAGRKNAIWFRYRLKNVSNKPIKITLFVNADEVDFYVMNKDEKLKHYKSGDAVPWSKKNGYKRLNAIPISLGITEEILVYCRTAFPILGLPDEFKIGFYNQRFFEKEADSLKSSNIKDSFFNGIFLLAALFNIFFFSVSRERVYLFLALFLFCFSFTYNPLVYLIIGKENPVLYVRFSQVNVVLWPFFFLSFIRYYFQTFKYVPRWDRVIIASGAFYPVVRFFNLYFHPNSQNIIVNSIDTFTTLILLVVMLITPFLFVKRQPLLFKSFIKALLPFFLITLTLIFLFILFFVFKIQLLLVASVFLEWSNVLISASVIWAVLNFSWLLFKRYDEQKRQISEQAIKVERLAREKEMQRSEMVVAQKIELEQQVEERTSELQQSIEELKSTQSQLIQSEKMASLGELTAGIAHEIQNPLNFVNNFSEVSNELIDEMKDELKNGNYEVANDIANDVKQNLEKINHHGKRADAIVKGMLQHSQSSTGKKEPTDINALCDEYLRLSYHGLRAKDKSFNADFKTDFDNSIGNINIIPQDIGRVILNLITNAFYAVNEKQKQNIPGYEPTVEIKTTKNPLFGGRGAEIRVSDNGGGIPQKILDKIFQPFFTTKPTGQGTGLGLSLSYDIIKAHGGELKVETKENEGSTFIIQLPVR